MHSSDLESEFVVLSPTKDATRIANTPDVYQKLQREFGNFAGHDLVTCYSFDRNWANWERHPNGDEIVVLLSGAATFILEMDGGRREIPLSRTGEYAIVPKGVWHTAQVQEPSRVLFITPGEGTEHRATEFAAQETDQ
ncbi:cupin domain-containing protein [Microbulbifer taiwanensis]|uniref:Cupin domain-containing protein n=1 Tax=Microbulbifer taiwanensis TaxID=986746 RepID=A0ABW1YRR0_9GAMM|nr:cupin domain-containing protein [Microbulbifer taiwanensis]